MGLKLRVFATGLYGAHQIKALDLSQIAVGFRSALAGMSDL